LNFEPKNWILDQKMEFFIRNGILDPKIRFLDRKIGILDPEKGILDPKKLNSEPEN